jgi:hypothetical protein
LVIYSIAGIVNVDEAGIVDVDRSIFSYKWTKTLAIAGIVDVDPPAMLEGSTS